MASQVPPSTKPTPYAERPPPPTPDLEQPEDYKKTFRSRMTVTKFADPCEAASKATYDCLERTHYNRSECQDFFRAYRECKGKWIKQRKEDRRLGRDTV
ncbi:cytochrome c oxidase-assembly factor COX23, mitochondrial [Tremella mesenterica]|uniref:Cytochrome c oxidase-assembly factor COX23, mitochondrial n=1 Tax=Tremella mesenterica TaxID=5217 RepID=A0A4Q1BJG9_TREME|nr:uncharacterized protein TREMEDRAFT_35781 [Tremella mesenterica DSM 1558]EIW65867.1 hypothetical protein TREMEDRAFT_35781 [Tremella mesenterica DSM 1558]RXK37854.1 cytochrome c oxidase-assembly factor COX23, mitochondrial [Tremella mesenterica]